MHFRSSLARITASIIALAFLSIPALADDPWQVNLGTNPSRPENYAIQMCVDLSTGPNWVAKPCGDAIRPMSVTVAGGGGGPASIADGADVTQGAKADAACATDTGTCTVEALLKREIQRLSTLITSVGSPLQAGGSIGNTGFASTMADGADVTKGSMADAACGTDTGSCSQIALLKRSIQRLTTIITSGLTAKPTNSTGAYTGPTIGTSSSKVVTSGTATVFLDVVNNSNAATICVNVGAVATINGAAPYCPAGEITLPPLWHRSWEGSLVPLDDVYMISSAASTPATIGAK